ncbi:probable disease resistance protein At5g04720 isoform X2 [Eucalyptus grandis]|uniref:probable disease resistance protein At5g04720 isoform X2 n=1 Tax=Eucalyptus grandis TaxID=71139 RepID=UPI00192E9B26|nr:probable disease resistance protein At5g04720 isoform X2 [Eucalyptus grandis]
MDSFNSAVVGPQFSHLKNLSTLHLCRCPLREIQLDGLELLGDLTVTYCEFLEGLLVISSSLRKLSEIKVQKCPKLLQIRFLSTMESLEWLEVGHCESLGGLYGLSNSKKLKYLGLNSCPVLRVIEGLEELELLQHLNFSTCPSLKVLTNLSNSKIPNECWIYVTACEKLPDCRGGCYGDYREEILEWRRRGFNQEGAARFFERGQPLIVQEDAGETDAEESVMETNNYYSQNLPLTIGFLWSPEPDTELDSTSLNNSQVPPRTTSSDVSRSSCSIL